MGTLIKLLDADITGIIFESQVSTRDDRLCTTCSYEYDVLEARIGFNLANGEEHILLDISDADALNTEQSVGITTTDMFKVFLDRDFLDLLKKIKLENLSAVLAERMWNMAETNHKKNLLRDALWEFLKDKEELKEYED